MESVTSKSKPSKKVMKRPALTSIKKALASSASKIKAKRGAKGVQTKADSQARVKRRRGTIYITHLPHGFYEDQLRDYFKQFGTVTGVKLPRSEKTGRSKGHAFVQFRDYEVAEVAAQSMNKYLMSNRIIEACLLTPRKAQRIEFTKGPPITRETCAKAKARRKFISKRNLHRPKTQHKHMVNKEQEKLEEMQKKLTRLGLPKVEFQDLFVSF